jgi:hypothetical protein
MSAAKVSVVWLVLLIPAGLSGQEITARAEVDSLNYLVGDPIHVSVELKHPAGLVFNPVIADTIGRFHLISHPELRKLDETTTRGELTAAYFDSGTVRFPSVTFSYLLPGDSSVRTVATDPLTLHVSLVEVDTTQPIRDIKPPIEIPITMAEIAAMVGILLAIAAVAYVVHRLWKRRKAKQEGAVVAVPPRPAHIVALEELATLREKKLWQQGLVKHYYSELTEIVRRYFENRYGVKALEQTTGEIMRDLQTHVRSNTTLGRVEGILAKSDLVKFAKFAPPLVEHEEVMKVACDIVETTKPVPQAEEGTERHE